MYSRSLTPAAYVASLSAERRSVIERLRAAITGNLPHGFVETMAYGMLAYVVPHEIYSAGYHCDPRQPLPFMNLAAQKNYVSVYHMGLYGGPLLRWLKTEWPRHTTAKLDLGKCCLRFTDLDSIPYDLVGQLAGKTTVAEWIATYEKATASRRNAPRRAKYRPAAAGGTSAAKRRRRAP